MTGRERNGFWKCQPGIVKPETIVNRSNNVVINQ